MVGFAIGQQQMRSDRKRVRWLKIKRRFIEVAADRIDGRPICHACLNFGANDLHHLTYETYGNEKFSDLMLLCETCHRLIHRTKHKMKCDILAATKNIVDFKRSERRQLIDEVRFGHRTNERIFGITSTRQRAYQLTKYDVERLTRNS